MVSEGQLICSATYHTIYAAIRQILNRGCNKKLCSYGLVLSLLKFSNFTLLYCRYGANLLCNLCFCNLSVLVIILREQCNIVSGEVDLNVPSARISPG